MTKPHPLPSFIRFPPQTPQIPQVPQVSSLQLHLAWYLGPFPPVIKCMGRAGKGPGSTSRVHVIPRNVQCWAVRSHHSVHKQIHVQRWPTARQSPSKPHSTLNTTRIKAKHKDLPNPVWRATNTSLPLKTHAMPLSGVPSASPQGQESLRLGLS